MAQNLILRDVEPAWREDILAQLQVGGPRHAMGAGCWVGTQCLPQRYLQ